jgi:hypothetical protein
MAVVGMLGALVGVYLLLRLMSTTTDIARVLRSSEPRAPVASVPPGDASSEHDAPTAGATDGGTTPRPGAIALDASPPEPEDAGTDPEVEPFDAAIDASAVPSPQPEAAAAGAVAEAAAPVRCGTRTCAQGEVCCNWVCGICTRPGEFCDLLCGAPNTPVSIPCGPNTCNMSQICCNRTCGTCVAVGETCSQKPCDTMYNPLSVSCGKNTCNVGQVCCNPTCGICTAPGEPCSPEPCP